MTKKDFNKDAKTDNVSDSANINNIAEEKALSAEDIVKLAEQKANEYKDMAQRLQAEFENFRKRNNDAVKNARIEGINDVLLDFIPVIDNFERATSMVKDEQTLQGINLIFKQFTSVFSKFDVKEIEATNQDFDPLLHNAVMQVEDSENVNKVVEVLQKGYTRNNKVLRYAMVKVAK